MKRKESYILGTLLVLVLLGLFYWYQIRPAGIRSKCVEVAKEGKLKTMEGHEFYYKDCIHEGGLER